MPAPYDAPAASALERLERRVAWGLRNLQAARVSGVVTEVSMSHYRVAGLSRFLRLGGCVSVDVGDRIQIGEVVKIDDASATLKPFDARCDAAIGARAYRTENLSLSPDASWKGRVIDALGRPLDGAGDLAYGTTRAARRRSASGDAACARVSSDPDGRARGRSLHPALPWPAYRSVCGFGRGQVVIAGDARPRSAIRHRRHRPRRRTWKGSTRIPR